MPRIFDNLSDQDHLLPARRHSLQESYRADFCVGYFNLRGWQHLADSVEHFSGTDGQCCRILIGMYRLPEAAMQQDQRAFQRQEPLDGPATARLRLEAAQHFRTQLETGIPTRQAQVAPDGQILSQSLAGVFRLSACAADTPALPIDQDHHRQVQQLVVTLAEEQLQAGGQLGSLRSTRRKLYERLKRCREQLQAQPTPRPPSRTWCVRSGW